MPNVVIIGNSGAARECYWILADIMHASSSLNAYYRFTGFLSWNGYEGDLKGLSEYFLGDADDHKIQVEELFVIGIAQPSLRKAVFEKFESRGANFLNLVHPWADICPSAIIGEANIFQRGSTVFCDAKVGHANYFNGAVNLSHDTCVGDYNFIGPASMLLGGCQIGSENALGTRTTLLPKARIGNNNVIAPGSIIYKGCKSNCRLSGNPALKIGQIVSI